MKKTKMKTKINVRDCIHAIYIGRGKVACELDCIMKASGGFCIGKRRCINFNKDKLKIARKEVAK